MRQPRSSSKNRGFLNQLRRRARRRKTENATVQAELLEERTLLSATIGDFRERDYMHFNAQHRAGEPGEFVTGPSSGDPVNIGVSFLRSRAFDMGTTPTHINNADLQRVYFNDTTGVTHLYLTQMVNGLPIEGAWANVNVTEDGEVMNAGSSFIAQTGNPGTAPAFSAIDALDAIVEEFEWEYTSDPAIINDEGGLTQRTTITPSGISREDITAQLHYVQDGSGVDLAWEIRINTLDRLSQYDISVSATDLDILHLEDNIWYASYTAYGLPGENPNDTGLVRYDDPHHPVASPFGWHDTDGAAGHEFTDTRGNNVVAQEDKDGDDMGGARPDGGDTLDFNYTHNQAEGADHADNENLSVTQLFYLVNLNHDIFYLNGFDEASGNFRTTNYTGLGLGGDAVRADTLDSFDNGARNNAFFTPAPEGTSPAISMFVWDSADPTRDSSMSGTVVTHEFGHGVSTRLIGGANNVNATNAVQARAMGEGWSDFFALMLTQKISDQRPDLHSVGNYLLGNSNNNPNGGIRSQPYTTDMTINTKTYGDFSRFGGPHFNGEIMAVTLWDLNWMMIEGDGLNIPGQGFNPDMHDGDAGNNLALKLVVEAMKLAPANPSYLDYRDAVLLADQNLTGGANELAIWTVFARRGMGFSADDGGSGNSSNVTEAFDLPPGLLFRVTINADEISEDDGLRATTARVQRPSLLSGSTIIVTLVNSDPSEISIPASVVIPAGRTFVDFDIDAIDDTLLDGTQTVSITAITPDFPTFVDTLDVLDAESLTLEIIEDEINEDDGPRAATGRLTRSNTDTTPPNLLVGSGDTVFELDRTGVELANYAIPYGPLDDDRLGTEHARDLVVTAGGDVAVYNGTETVYFSQLDLNTTSWTHDVHAGLSTDSTGGTGGITAFQNFVFLTDMNTPGGPDRGLVRFDSISGQSQRFARTVPGERIFGTRETAPNVFEIAEIDPLTGAVVNSFASPGTPGIRDGMAFDGRNLWYVDSGIGEELDDLYRIDPDTGAAVLIQTGIVSGVDGLAVIDDLLFILDGGSQNDIIIYDPFANEIVRILDIDGLAPGVSIGGGLAAARNPNTLFASDAFSRDIYEIDPETGEIINTFQHGMVEQGFGVFDLGLAVVNDEIYVSTRDSDEIEIYDRETLTLVRELTVPGTEGFSSLAGDGVQGAVLSPYDFTDVVTGLDGLIYALDEGGQIISAYDPITLQLDRFVQLETPVNAIAVDGLGQVFGVTAAGVIIGFDEFGTQINTLDTLLPGLIDMDIALNGDLVISSAGGDVILTDRTLAAFTSFNVGDTAFVSFASAPGSSTGDLPVTILNDDPSEISAPMVVTIPAGEQSVEFFIDAVDDFLFDGTQTATLTPFAFGYSEINDDSIDVLDVESILIDIVEDEITENDGPGAASVALQRGNVDGPFDHPSVFAVGNTDDRTILDDDTIISTVEVAPQLAFVSDINVTITLEHEFLGDLDVSLVSPAGTRVLLFDDVGNNGTNMTGLTLDDEAFTSVAGASSPFTGHFQPESFLSAFDGEEVTGTWTLEIVDDTVVHSGMLREWSIEFGMLGLPALEITLQSSDETEAVPTFTTVTIPINQLATTTTLDAVDDNILDGIQNAVVTASTTGYSSGVDAVDVADYETIELTIDETEISENGGTAVGTVTRTDGDLSQALTITLTNGDPTEISIPATVEIPIGEASVDFDIFAVDDNVLDGTITVQIDAEHPSYIVTPESSATIDISDHEPILVVELDVDEIGENGSFVAGTVRRTNTTDISQPLSVTLTSSHPADAAVPPTITIPANEDHVTVTITINDNTVLDGDLDVTITAQAVNTFSGQADLLVTDHETLSFTFAPPSFFENGGIKASRATLTRNNTDIADELVVSLVNGDATEIDIPESAVIPAGETSVSFDVAAINDAEFDGTQIVEITAIAEGYVELVDTVEVKDHEPPVLVSPTTSVDTMRPPIEWEPVPGATGYHLRIDNITTGEFAVINERNLPGDISSYIPEVPLGVAKYRVRLRYYDSLEQLSSWSRYLIFRVRASPDFISPTRLPAEVPPEFSWTEVVNSVNYELRVSNLTTGQFNIINEPDLTGTTFTPESLPFGSYSARVRAIGENNQKGFWETINFTLLERPEFITPSPGATWDRLPTFSWTASEGADHYDFRMHNLTIGLNDGGANFIRDRFVPGTEFTPSFELEDGTYRVYVRAITAQDGAGLWTPGMVIRVGAAPTFTSPVNGAETDGFPTFVWTAVDGTERYDFRIRRGNNRNNIVRVRNLRTVAYTPDFELTSGEYRAWVRTISTLGEKSRWARVEFTVASLDAGEVSVDSDSQQILFAHDVPADTPTAAIEDAELVVIAADIPDAAVQQLLESADSTGRELRAPEPTDAIDAVMTELPLIESEDWDPADGEADATFDLVENAEGLLGEAGQPLAAVAGLGVGMMTGRRRRRRKNES